MIKAILRRTPIAALLVFTVTLTACGGGSDALNDVLNGEDDTSNNSDVALLRSIDNVEGTGAMANDGQELSVHYEGYLYDADAEDFRGEMFDSTVGGAPFTFTLGAGEVIDGWDQGVVGMKEGGNRTLIIPSRLAYGFQGAGPIPPSTAVVFDIELLSID